MVGEMLFEQMQRFVDTIRQANFLGEGIDGSHSPRGGSTPK
jgi:hypothetical protein